MDMDMNRSENGCTTQDHLTPEDVSSNISTQYERLRKVCGHWSRGRLSEDEVRRELDDVFFFGFTEFIPQHRLRSRLAWSKQGPWERFCEDYELWKNGEEPFSKAGDAWLTCTPALGTDEPEAVKEASCGDKARFFELMEAFHIPAEYYRPAPEGMVLPDRHAGHFNYDIVVGFDIWKDDGGLLSREFQLGDTIVLTDHHGLRSTIKVTERLTPQDRRYWRGISAGFAGTGFIEGYTTSREREILISVHKGKIFLLHVEMDADDVKAFEDFPLWKDALAFYEMKSKMREEIRDDLLRFFMDER